MATQFTALEIKSILSRYHPDIEPMPSRFKSASVLIPFYDQPEGLALVLMKRPDYQGAHGGQISFPGGAREQGDRNDKEVALRETEEEYGIDQGTIEIWGRLKPQFTRVSGYWVSPFVGMIPCPAAFQPDPNEVERLIVVPFAHLLDPDHFRIGTYEWKGFQVPSYLYEFNGETIWGLTARILFNLITLIRTGKESDRQHPPT